MNSLKNAVQLIGRLGNNPENRIFDSGKQMASFSMATNESYKNSEGETIEDTQWHTIIAWGKRAELVAQLLSKGDEVALSGKLTYRSFEQDGQKRFVTEIQLNEFFRISRPEPSDAD